jgi:PHD/YefM family antitoxin component YafN of YafNO toxin-antitoxin module
VKITNDGMFAAMLVSPQKWRSIIETLGVLADADAVGDLEEANAEIAAGGGVDAEEIAAMVDRRRETA